MCQLSQNIDLSDYHNCGLFFQIYSALFKYLGYVNFFSKTWSIRKFNCNAINGCELLRPLQGLIMDTNSAPVVDH